MTTTGTSARYLATTSIRIEDCLYSCVYVIQQAKTEVHAFAEFHRLVWAQIFGKGYFTFGAGLPLSVFRRYNHALLIQLPTQENPEARLVGAPGPLITRLSLPKRYSASFKAQRAITPKRIIILTTGPLPK